MYEQPTYGYAPPQTVAGISSERRAQFITRTYQHLFGAILAFIGIELLLFQTGLAETIARGFLSVGWIVVLGAFTIAGTIFSGMAARAESRGTQYAALAGYIGVEALIFVPMLYLADRVAPGAIQSAALTTLLGFSGLTAIAMYSGKDFSFMGATLKWIGVSALILVFTSLFFGFNLGTWFSVGMVAFAGAIILYTTSRILRTYREDRYVSASLELFAAVALMFWYVLRLFMSRR